MFSGSKGTFFQGVGEINALFSGIKGAQTPPGGLTTVGYIFSEYVHCDMQFLFEKNSA